MTNKFETYLNHLMSDTRENNYCVECGHLQAKHINRRDHCFEREYETGCFGPRGPGMECYCMDYKSPHPAPLDEHINVIEQ